MKSLQFQSITSVQNTGLQMVGVSLSSKLEHPLNVNWVKQSWVSQNKCKKNTCCQTEAADKFLLIFSMVTFEIAEENYR